MKKSFNSKKLLQATLASVIGITAAEAFAASDATPGINIEWEKCYGVSRAGENDCSSLNGTHLCAGHSTTDNDLNEYIWLPKGSCKRIVNGVSYTSKKSRNVKSWCTKQLKKINANKKK